MGGVPCSLKEISMTTTFQKRQKEMKRLDKQRAKAERRAQRKIEKRAGKEAGSESENLTVTDNVGVPVDGEAESQS